MSNGCPAYFFFSCKFLLEINFSLSSSLLMLVYTMMKLLIEKKNKRTIFNSRNCLLNNCFLEKLQLPIQTIVHSNNYSFNQIFHRSLILISSKQFLSFSQLSSICLFHYSHTLCSPQTASRSFAHQVAGQFRSF